jgi:hypothetical protein
MDPGKESLFNRTRIFALSFDKVRNNKTVSDFDSGKKVVLRGLDT